MRLSDSILVIAALATITGVGWAIISDLDKDDELLQKIETAIGLSSICYYPDSDVYSKVEKTLQEAKRDLVINDDYDSALDKYESVEHFFKNCSIQEENDYSILMTMLVGVAILTIVVWQISKRNRHRGNDDDTKIKFNPM